ncbi:MAG: 1-deoxy-D-xylulose-5-phosphate synthase [Clostridia bacterium]|nr:1-deoxy-D-xylulose-5-phosphate synthase [Clostridia bacterium]
MLNKISSPEDVKKLNNAQLQSLCKEVRECIIETVSKNGGHLASNLGAVELTIALHRTFNSPKDAIIFDVGHQCYTHKLLTGRFDRFSTLRTEGGISGFMKPSESEHDPVITGHSSNSISAAYGIYCAKKLSGDSGTAVAVIGDGALTGGMAYEALNNVAASKSNFIVILNDNKMSISRNVGGLSRSLTKMRNKPKYHNFKFAISKFLLKIPFGKYINSFIFSVKEILKSIIYKNNFFSSLGFNYLGPVDGHNIEAMEELFKVAQSYNRPSLVHVVTTKGKGYHYAETSPKNYHGVSPFVVEEGAITSGKLTFSDVAGKTLCEMAGNDPKICAITAAMTSGTGLSEFAKTYKNRFFDVGIAEQHAVTFCAGLKKGGMKPYFAVYSSFLQRAYDQIIHDCAVENLPITLLVDRAGIVGEDGETHQGLFDISYLTSIPNVEIFSPASFMELEYYIKQSANSRNVTAIRYPRGSEAKNNIEIDFKKEFYCVSGKGKKAIVTYGRLFNEALKAKEKDNNLDVIKLNKVFPFSDDLVKTLLTYSSIHFYEETIKSGGIGEHLISLLLQNGFKGEYTIHAIDNKFVPAASVASTIAANGLDYESMLRS